MSNVFARLDGTTSNNFRIGKGGPTIYRGDGVPTDPDVQSGSLFISSSGDAYKKSDAGWNQLMTVDMIPVNTQRAVIEYSSLDVGGSITFSHTLNETYVVTQMYNSDGYFVVPDNIHVGYNSITVDLHSYLASESSFPFHAVISK